MVVKVIVPISRKMSSAEADSGVLWDPDASQSDLMQALKRICSLGTKAKFLNSGTKAATPLVRALLHVLKTRSQVGYPPSLCRCRASDPSLGASRWLL